MCKNTENRMIGHCTDCPVIMKDNVFLIYCELSCHLIVYLFVKYFYVVCKGWAVFKRKIKNKNFYEPLSVINIIKHKNFI